MKIMFNGLDRPFELSVASAAHTFTKVAHDHKTYYAVKL
jgi:hypothetical protein